MPVGPRALVTLAEARDWLNVATSFTGENTEIERVIDDVSDRMHQESGREFKAAGTNPQTRTFPVTWRGRSSPFYIDGDYAGELNPLRRTIRVGDLASFTQAQILDTDWTTVLETVAMADITSHPTVRQEWEPIRELEFHSDVTSLSEGMRVAVTGNFGFPAVPGNVRQAVLDAIAATFDRDVEHYRQDLGAPSPGEGGTVIVVGGSQRLLSMPPAAIAVAWSYRDHSIG